MTFNLDIKPSLSKLKEFGKEYFPKGIFTLVVIYWEDKDFELEYRYHDDEIVHSFTYLKSTDEYKYIKKYNYINESWEGIKVDLK